jgi:hypothetical protein
MQFENSKGMISFQRQPRKYSRRARGGAISRNQMIVNKRMSAVRICVEWAFGKVLSLFAYLDFKKKSKGLPTTCRKILQKKKHIVMVCLFLYCTVHIFRTFFSN